MFETQLREEVDTFCSKSIVDEAQWSRPVEQGEELRRFGCILRPRHNRRSVSVQIGHEINEIVSNITALLEVPYVRAVGLRRGYTAQSACGFRWLAEGG